MPKKKITIFYIASIIFTLDRLSKYLILELSNYSEYFNFTVTSFLNLNLVFNKGIAFGLFSVDDKIYYNIITLIIIIITLVVLVMAFKTEGIEKYGFSMIFDEFQLLCCSEHHLRCYQKSSFLDPKKHSEAIKDQSKKK